MNELTTRGQAMSSLQIAEITGKQHAHVMEAIRSMETAWQKVSQSNFRLASYTDKQGKERPCYQLTKTECLYIATKFNDEARAKLVLRWEELESGKATPMAFQIPQTFSQALMLAAKQQEQIEEQQQLLLAQGNQITDLQEEISEMLPKVSYYDQILQSKSTVCTTQIAQDYGMSAKKFNIELRNLHIQRKVNGQWILYAPYNKMGYVHSETFIPENSTTGKVISLTKWTQRGRLFLYDKLKQKGILPLIEQPEKQQSSSAKKGGMK